MEYCGVDTAGCAGVLAAPADGVASVVDVSLALVLGTCVALVTGVGLTLLLLSSVSTAIGVGHAVDKDFLKIP